MRGVGSSRAAPSRRSIRGMLVRLGHIIYPILSLAIGFYLVFGLLEAWYGQRISPQSWWLSLRQNLFEGLGFDVEPLGAGTVRFERPFAVVLLLAPLLVWIAQAYLHRFEAPRLLISRGAALKPPYPIQSPSENSSSGRPHWGYRLAMRDLPLGLRFGALVLIVLALMGPQSIHAKSTASIEGIDIMLTLDLSLSMQASDIEPSRFEASKYVVDDFIRRRPNDRIGAVVFGQQAYTLLPLTTDRQALRQTIAELQLNVIDGRGTAIGNAVGTSLNRLRRSTAESKVVILLTDGNSNSGNISPDQAANFADTMNVRIFTVLMGQNDEAPVRRGFGLFGNPILDVGHFPVNPELLEDMAKITGGAHFHVSDRQGLIRSFHQILDELERSHIEDQGRVYSELFPAFLTSALILLMMELLLRTLLLRRWP
ncbi:MAG: VWA domain-containing protein [Myxococcota bacterium]